MSLSPAASPYVLPRRAAGVALLFAAFLAAGQGVAASAPTLAEITAAPFPSNIAPGPHGSEAWVFNERGARNIWIRAGGQAARRLTANRHDDGREIWSLQWSASGRSLVYVAGGDAGGRVAVDLPGAGPSIGEVWVIPAGGGAPRRLDRGVEAAPSPTEEQVAYVRDGAIWVAPLDGGAPVRLFEAPGVSAPTWSPDGRRLAVVGGEGDSSHVGIYDMATGQLRWLAQGPDSDFGPAWSRNGDKIAFARTPAGEDGDAFYSHRTGKPWEIWIADTATGPAHRVWQAQPGVGSKFRDLFNSPSLQWAGDSLVFPWEVGGWVRLYALAAVGGPARPLTAAGAEVFNAAVTRDGRAVVVATNAGDQDRRHLWRATIDGARFSQLTHSDGVEDIPVISADGRLLALRGEPRRPVRPIQVGPDGVMRDLAPAAVPVAFPTARLITPRLVTFTAAEGRIVHGQLFLPSGPARRHPAVMFFHGGPTYRQMFASWDPFETHNHLYGASQYLATHGYVVLSVNYRGGAGYGFEFREDPAFGAGGASELNDIVAAARYLKARPEVDPARLGVWGGSYGGRMASLALARAPDAFAAGVIYAGVHDWLTMPQFKPRPNGEALARESGSIAAASAWRAPVLLIHGTADGAVPLAQDEAMTAALKANGVEVHRLLLPGEVHFLLRQKSWDIVIEAMKAFFDEKLLPSRP